MQKVLRGIFLLVGLFFSTTLFAGEIVWQKDITAAFEKAQKEYFNSLVVIDADGTIMDNYRKTHIPDGAGYEEDFYFKSGDTGFKVYDTIYAKIGVGICWDQWFYETTRCLALKGAEIIFFPNCYW